MVLTTSMNLMWGYVQSFVEYLLRAERLTTCKIQDNALQLRVTALNKTMLTESKEQTFPTPNVQLINIRDADYWNQKFCCTEK